MEQRELILIIDEYIEFMDCKQITKDFYKRILYNYNLDVRIFRDDKIRDLNYHVGPLGELVYIRRLTLVYENRYYLETTISTLAKILHKDLASQWIKLKRISMLSHACLEAGFFDDELAGQGVITSVAVQKQYLLLTQRRKEIYITKYWLLERGPSEKRTDGSLSISKDTVNHYNNVVNVCNNSLYANKKKQS